MVTAAMHDQHSQHVGLEDASVTMHDGSVSQ
jgi:hypothetical protein